MIGLRSNLELYSLKQKLAKVNSLKGMINWDKSAGNPFDYDTFGVNDIKIESSVPTVQFVQNYKKLEESEKLIEIGVYVNLKMLHSLNIQQSEILYGLDDGFFINDLSEFLDNNKPIEVCLDYPFKNKILVNIPNIILDEIEPLPYSVGNLSWQISNAYAFVYKNLWKKAGNIGHAFCDLSLERISIYENNVIDISIGS